MTKQEKIQQRGAQAIRLYGFGGCSEIVFSVALALHAIV